MTLRTSVAAIALLMGLTPALAHAEGANAAAAEGFFQEGLSLLESGKTKEACEKFVASYRLDPANGTLQNVASCHEKEGKSASAWAEWLELAGKASRAGQKDREQIARRRAAEIAKDLARLELRVPPSSNVATVEIDGQALDRSAWSAPLPLDPGAHAIVYKAPGKKSATASVTIKARSNAAVDVPKLDDDPTASSGDEAPKTDTKPRFDRSRRTIGFVVGGAGIALAGAGAVFGVLALTKKNDASCEDAVCPTQSAVDERDSAKTSATISTIGLGVGIVAIAVGAYLVLSSTTKTPSKSTTALLGPDLHGFRWAARW